MGFPTRSSRCVVREILLVGIAAAASFVFINHDNLYLSHPFRLSDARIESYFLATAMAYLFLRLVIVALELRLPRGHSELVRCPECGDRKSTRLNSSHQIISYAVFCLKKKKRWMTLST